VNISGTTTRTLQVLGAELEDELLGPHKATDANVHTVKTRGGMHIPFEFMPLVLGKNLTTRESYLLLVPAIMDAGMEATSQPLIDWLTVALTDPSATAPETVNLKPCLGRLHFSPSPAIIISRRAEILYRDLPVLNATPGGGGDPYLRDVARAVGDLAVEARANRNDRHDRRTELAQPKGVREKFGDRLTDRFLLLCRVSDDDALPGVFHEWAARPKGVSERYVLQQALDEAYATLHLIPYQVTPAHVMAFKNLQFAGCHADCWVYVAGRTTGQVGSAIRP
jgi:hypothetical protein